MDKNAECPQHYVINVAGIKLELIDIIYSLLDGLEDVDPKIAIQYYHILKYSFRCFKKGNAELDLQKVIKSSVNLLSLITDKKIDIILKDDKGNTL